MSTTRRYAELHWGIAADRDVEAKRPRKAPREHTQLGRLVELHVVQVIHFDEGDVHLTEGTDGELWVLSPGGVWVDGGGELLRVVYETAKGSERGRKARALWYEHEFEGKRPWLAADAEGHAVIERRDSQYTIEDRGIVG